jgi:hypothetical protein
MAEIDEEVERLRSSGALPAGLERELDELFARFTPVGAVREEFEQVLEKVEQASFIDPRAPVASNLPGGSLVKSTIRRLVTWNVEYVTRQVSGFSHGVVSALRALDERLRELEGQAESSPRTTLELPTVPTPVVANLKELLSSRLAGAPGRILHAECGDGWLLSGLLEAGIDCYGVEPAVSLALEAGERGLDVRSDAALDHLRRLGDGVLGGLVLSGCVDRLSRVSQLELADLAWSALARGGVLAVLGTDPRAWARTHDPVEVDLVAGRPLHGETWAFVLAEKGFDVAGIHRDPPATPVEGADKGEGMRLLTEAVFGSGPYVVLGRRIR